MHQTSTGNIRDADCRKMLVMLGVVLREMHIGTLGLGKVGPNPSDTRAPPTPSLEPGRHKEGVRSQVRPVHSLTLQRSPRASTHLGLGLGLSASFRGIVPQQRAACTTTMAFGLHCPRQRQRHKGTRGQKADDVHASCSHSLICMHRQEMPHTHHQPP